MRRSRPETEQLRAHTDLKFGRHRSAQRDIDRTPRLKEVLRSGYSGVVPDTVDWTGGGKISYPMDLNDQLGDCTAAGAAHAEETWSYLGQGALVNPTQQDVVNFYSGSTGYVQGDPSTDQGGDMQTVLAYWMSTGMAGHKIAGFFAIDPTDFEEMRAALYLFGPLYIGFEFPQSAMDQFNAGKPWDYSRAGSQIVGGHCVTVQKMVKGGNLTVVTWGTLEEMTPAFWSHYVDEPYIALSQEWINNSTSMTPAGLDYAAANAAVASVFGKPGPFVVGSGGNTPPTPVPTPTPTPTPTPAPTPTPSNVTTLLQNVDASLKANSAAIEAFLSAGSGRHAGK